TPDDFSALDWPFRGTKTHRPNVWCRFHAWEGAKKSDAHLKVRVVRLRATTLKTFDFSSDKHHWDTADANLENKIEVGGATWFDANGKPVRHSHIPHEVGHALGLQHIGPTMCALTGGTCPADPYMVGTDTGATIMGLRTRVERVTPRPWQRHIVQHSPDDASKPEDWVAWSDRQFPRKLSDIPGAGAPAAAAAGS